MYLHNTFKNVIRYLINDFHNNLNHRFVFICSILLYIGTIIIYTLSHEVFYEQIYEPVRNQYIYWTIQAIIAIFIITKIIAVKSYITNHNVWILTFSIWAIIQYYLMSICHIQWEINIYISDIVLTILIMLYGIYMTKTYKK